MIKGINIISSEFEYVCSVHSSINTYGVGSAEIVDDNKSYPFLLFNTDQSTSINIDVLRNGLPKKRSYSCRLLLHDEYSESEKQTKSITEKYEELESVLAQYIAAVYRRSRNNDSQLSIGGQYEIEYAQRANHDNLVRVGCNIDVYIYSTNCDLGDFTTLIAPSVTISSDGNSITLNWTHQNDSIDGFKVYKAESLESDYVLLSSLDSSTLSYDDTEISHFHIYFYKVEVYKSTFKATSDIIYTYSPGH